MAEMTKKEGGEKTDLDYNISFGSTQETSILMRPRSTSFKNFFIWATTPFCLMMLMV